MSRHLFCEPLVLSPLYKIQPGLCLWSESRAMLCFFFFLKKKITEKGCWHWQVCPWGGVRCGDREWRKQTLQKRPLKSGWNVFRWMELFRKASTKVLIHACMILGLLQPPNHILWRDKFNDWFFAMDLMSWYIYPSLPKSPDGKCFI